MKRHIIRSLALFGLVVAAAATARAQNANPDTIEIRNRKDGTTKSYRGYLKVGPAGFQVLTGDKLDKASEPIAPDDIVKVTVGDLPNIKTEVLAAVREKEDAALKVKGNKSATKEYADAVTAYRELGKASGLPDRTKRYLDFKVVSLNQRPVDEMDAADPAGKEAWGKAADKVAADWKDFISTYNAAGKMGWEVWSAARIATRVQTERGKYDEAASVWGSLRRSKELPADARLEAGLQEIDFQIRAKAYSNASLSAADPDMQKATGSRKERLAVYELAAKAGGEGKPLDGVDKIKAAMDKTKDPTVHAAGYAMMGELYLAAGKPRDAMWMFLWVETVVNQDKDEVFKAIARLTELFDAQTDEDQSKKYREKIKRFRSLI
ncbi:hypothetical protein GobsT_66810 [Gemmata obscuriglobus]|uniref:Tetratricopeptide repeat protein n=1 Tax=Gemmata obscuriglobus TaxID=114 RepID=A0A2Z3GW77_9BACT|nr:hypothetical protein [Gemmata obscuriglobus]AWM35636.1 hypothetical protein C1280_00430 [Gemmata obscuriglobus]QEG31835.1 hypothetical protein GobsT_66810 [Gemmata obscuriglobus]VTS11181.1 hypothetical protein : [Gemmata obscuriglobus UQM 2246]